MSDEAQRIEDAALAKARESLQDQLGDELRAARLAAQRKLASFDPRDASLLDGTIYFERPDGKWPAEAGSFSLPARAIEARDDGAWVLNHTIHWPSGTPDAEIVAVWLVWPSMACRIALPDAIELHNESSDFIPAGTLVMET